MYWLLYYIAKEVSTALQALCPGHLTTVDTGQSSHYKWLQLRNTNYNLPKPISSQRKSSIDAFFLFEFNFQKSLVNHVTNRHPWYTPSPRDLCHLYRNLRARTEVILFHLVRPWLMQLGYDSWVIKSLVCSTAESNVFVSSITHNCRLKVYSSPDNYWCSRSWLWAGLSWPGILCSTVSLYISCTNTNSWIHSDMSSLENNFSKLMWWPTILCLSSQTISRLPDGSRPPDG